MGPGVVLIILDRLVADPPSAVPAAIVKAAIITASMPPNPMLLIRPSLHIDWPAAKHELIQR